MIRVIIVPGNGCTNARASNWYGWLEKRLKQEGFTDIVLQDMPDPYKARESIWIPFLNSLVNGKGENTVVVGHSSGAECAMRYLENHKLYGVVLVSACWTDLGDPNERQAGYYSRPWDWEAIRSNVSPGFGIVQFHSSDDPLVPIAEAEYVAKNLCSEPHFFEDRSHFFEPFEEIVSILKVRLKRFLGI